MTDVVSVRFLAVRTFYRITLTNPPTVDDFKSNIELGRPPRHNDPETIRLEEGISPLATFSQARRMARSFPSRGSFIAELAISDHAPFVIQRTLRTPGHHTIWGAHDKLFECIVAVRPVTS